MDLVHHLRDLSERVERELFNHWTMYVSYVHLTGGSADASLTFSSILCDEMCHPSWNPQVMNSLNLL
jgi:hypothetical protein